jgi:hypothetical protein
MLAGIYEWICRLAIFVMLFVGLCWLFCLAGYAEYAGYLAMISGLLEIPFIPKLWLDFLAIMPCWLCKLYWIASHAGWLAMLSGHLCWLTG